MKRLIFGCNGYHLHKEEAEAKKMKMRASFILAGSGGQTRLEDVLRETGFGGSDVDYLLWPPITIKAQECQRK